MLTIERLHPSHEASVLAIQLSDEHIKFASTPCTFLSDPAPAVDKHIIRNNDDIIGFFKLDLGYSQEHVFCSDSDLGFRTLALDSRYQGKGLGSQCMKLLPLYVAEQYPEFEFIYLTVNCKNMAALACYQKGGFADTGKLYLSGPAGPQHIMRKNIT